MMLGDDLDSKVILFDIDLRTCTDSLHQTTLYLSSSIIGVMEDTELRVSSLTMEVKGTIILLVEVYAPLHHLLYLFWSISYYLFYSLAVRDIVACDYGVGNMFVESVYFEICDTCHTALGKRCVSLIK